MAKKTVREISSYILTRVARGRGFVDILLDEQYSDRELTSVDKMLMVELVNGTLRWRGYLDWILQQLFHGDFKRSPAPLKSILQMSLYQLIYLDRLPNYAVVSEAVKLAKKLGGERWGKLVNGVLRSYLRQGTTLETPQINGEAVTALSITCSHPKWLIKRWVDLYGMENTRRYCDYNNRRPSVTLRLSSLPGNREDIIVELRNDGFDVQPSPFFADFIKINNKKASIFEHSLFTTGALTVQDESTALASLLVAPENGDTVLDMCAAPGGKTCHLAQLMKGSGKVIAVDIEEKRLQRLSQNVNRLGLQNIEILNEDAVKLKISPVDKILLDAPCSGLGVLSKRADLRWRRQPADIDNIRQIQIKLINSAAELLRPEGVLVYSTCTLEPEETDSVIHQFLQAHNNFKIDCSYSPGIDIFKTEEGFWRTLPFENEIDGSFAVRLLKK